jgi:UDPglucose--hexose-1-phosphate uridylyltransferase
MKENEIVGVLSAYKERCAHLASDGRFKFILILKNRGLAAGASLHHPHSQIIAMPFVPELISREPQDFLVRRQNGEAGAAYEELIRIEKEQGVRMVLDQEHFSVHCPYSSRFPFEVLIVPKKHNASFTDAESVELRSLAQILKNVLGLYAKILDDPPYNFYIHSAPCDGGDYSHYHWHIHLAPKSMKLGSFEIGTGVYINSVPSERAAEILRDHVVQRVDQPLRGNRV